MLDYLWRRKVSRGIGTKSLWQSAQKEEMMGLANFAIGNSAEVTLNI